MQNVLLIVNSGSTSVKTKLFDTGLQVRAELALDCAALPVVAVAGHDWQGGQTHETWQCASLEACLRAVFARWQQQLLDLPVTLAAVGHRIVHGGDRFTGLTLLDTEALQCLEQFDHLAPLHNPVNRLGVCVARGMFPRVPQYGVFDTAFHRTMPSYAQTYAIPAASAKQTGLHRFGFHGIACRQVLHKTAQFLKRPEAALNLIVLHLGGGASATAIRGGESIDTSMGFSPMEGLMMASRCGDIDPMLPLMLLQQDMTVAEVERLLNRESGLTGVCGSGDMRVVLERAQQGDAAAELAVAMFCYRIKKYIGAYWAVLGKVDALVFSGGIGENAGIVRARILAGLEPLGLVLDANANSMPLLDTADLSAPSSATRIIALRVNEEQEIAGQILRQLGG